MKRILDIPVTDTEFQMLKFVIDDEEMAGWKPTRADIIKLIRSGRRPSQRQRQDMRRFNAEMDRSYRLNKNRQQ